MKGKLNTLYINELQKAFAENTRAIIKARGISQNKLGEMLGISKFSISDKLNNNSTLKEVCRVADALKVSPFDLMKQTTQNEDKPTE